MARLRGKLTFANVVSCLALFVALGGASYAASQLPKNSVGTKQIKSNAVITAKIKKEAVTAAKVKKGTLTGAQINLAKLGTVPSATTAATANGLAPLEAQHYIGEAGQPSFENGAGNLPTEGPLHYGRASFYKDHDGIVHLEGTVKAGSTSGVVFTLPPGFRPTSGTLRVFPFEAIPVYVFGSNYSAEGLELSGKVYVPEEEEVALDGITFRAES